MRFIDVHTHPGFNDPLFQNAAAQNKIDYTEKGYFSEMKENNIDGAVAIGWNLETNEAMARLAEKHDMIVPVFGVKLDQIKRYCEVAAKGMKEKRYCGFKIFLGYEPVYPDSKELEPVYKMAEKYDVPVIFHTGDTWNQYNAKGRVKFAHPLGIDDLAVRHDSMRILIAHAGNPWTDDTAEVIYKNDNCFADISGWFLNDVEKGHAELMRAKLNFLVNFASSEKLMFGTDWPLIKMGKYTSFLRGSGLEEEYIENMAHKTAKTFWGI